MRIIVLHRYFWPQPYPYASMLKDIVVKLVSYHSVSVLTTNAYNLAGKQAREEFSAINNVKIEALSLGPEKKSSIVRKIINSAYFGSWVFYKLLTSKVDVVLVATTPPIIIAMIVRWVSFLRRYKYIYHCLDIHPEGIHFCGNMQKGIIYNLLLRIDKKNIDEAWKVITLSEDMKQTLAKRGCITSHVKIINNFIFIDDDLLPTIKPKKSLNINKTKFNFIFAGSLGRLQNLDVLMQSIVLLKHRNDIHFTFMGDGIMFKEMTTCKKINQLDNVDFHGHLSVNEVVGAMQIADIGIVSIGSNISRIAYPSKTMMYLGCGLPIFGLVDENTELFNFINNNKIGKVVSPTSAKNIAKSIEMFSDDMRESPIDKSHVKKIAKATFSKEVILPQLLDIIHE